LRATNDSAYKNDVEKHYKEFNLTKNLGFSWYEKSAGVHALMAKITNESVYKSALQTYCHYITVDVKKTPKGLTFIGKWGSLREVSNAAFICLQVIIQIFLIRIQRILLDMCRIYKTFSNEFFLIGGRIRHKYRRL
jgi:hypothetical protein